MSRHGFTSRRASLAGLVFVLTTGATSVHAQAARSGGGGGESQKIMQQYQQLAAEKTSLQTQLGQAKKDLDAAKTELAAVKKERDALKARSSVSTAAAAQLAQANASRENVEKSLEQNKQRTAELVDRFKETVGTLKGVESEKNQLKSDNLRLTAAYDKCSLDNDQLYTLSNTVLDRYEHVGFFTKVGNAEPFTKITRARIDNLVDEYRAHAEELRVKKPAT
jgi:DNA repair exonuclease SbcCD ATPase subunit